MKTNLTQEVDRLQTALTSVGVKRISLVPSDSAAVAKFSGLAFFSTIGPYNPALFEKGEYQGEKRMIEGYLRVHCRLIEEQIPTILVVRDQFALGLRVPPGEQRASAAQVAGLVRNIGRFAMDFINDETGKTPPQHLFQVVRESHFFCVDDLESVRLLADLDMQRISAHFGPLDVRNGLDLMSTLKKMPQIKTVSESHFGPDYMPVLIEWEGTIKLWQEAGIGLSVSLAELETIEGPRDTRTFYERGLERIATV